MHRRSVPVKDEDPFELVRRDLPPDIREDCSQCIVADVGNSEGRSGAPGALWLPTNDGRVATSGNASQSQKGSAIHA